MGKFVAVHPVGGNMDLEAATPIGRAVKANCTADAYHDRTIVKTCLPGLPASLGRQSHLGTRRRVKTRCPTVAEST